MAIEYINGDSAWNAAAGSSIAAPAIDATTGNTIIVCVNMYYSGVSISGVSDTAGNSYSICGSAEGGDSSHKFAIYVAHNIVGNSSNVVTATYSSSSTTYRGIIVAQYSGLRTSSSYDASASVKVDSSTTTSHTSNTTGTTAVANELVVAFFCYWNAGYTFSASGSYNLRLNNSTNMALVDRIVTSTGTFTPEVTTATANQLVSIVRTFKGATEPATNGTFTYSTSTHRITVTGGTSSNPADFYSMLAADEAGGWGMLTKMGTDNAEVWKLDAALTIGDGTTSTYFKARSGVIFQTSSWNTTGDNASFCTVTANATLHLGTLVDADTRKTSDGVVWCKDNHTYYDIMDGSGTVLLYNSVFTDGMVSGQNDSNINGGGFASGSRVWNCRFQSGHQLNGYGSLDVYGCQFLNQPYGTRGPTNTMTMSDCQALACNNLVYFTWGSEAIELIRPMGRNLANHVLTYHVQNTYCGVTDADLDVDDWSNEMIGETSNCKIFRRYTVNIRVVDVNGNPIEGASVNMYEQEGGFSNDLPERAGFNNLLTDADGRITPTVVSRGYYTETDPDTLFDYSPHIIRVTKTGYQTLVLPGLVLTGPLNLTLKILGKPNRVTLGGSNFFKED